MTTTPKLHDLGQSLWLDNITRDMIGSGALRRYVDEVSVTGLTSNPTIFDLAIKNSGAYDAAIQDGARSACSGPAPAPRTSTRAMFFTWKRWWPLSL